MNARKPGRVCVLFVILTLLFTHSITASGLAELAEYWSFIPVVMRTLGYRESTGVLDPSFDGDGIVLTDIGIAEAVHDIVMQPDGKILTVGYTAIIESTGGAGMQENVSVALLRYNLDGSLDDSFGSGGKLVTDFGGYDYGYGAALQPDGKIVMAGYAFIDVSVGTFVLARYHPDGSLDTTFDGDGKVITDFNSSEGYARAVAIQPDGKIVAAGFAFDEMYSDFALARYNPDGSLDESFGSGGKVTTDFYGQDDYGYSIVLQPDDKIIVGGQAGNCPHSCLALARYNPDGSLDTSFEDDGKVTADVSSQHDLDYSMALQADGKIVIAGAAWREYSDTDFALVRYHPNGDVDLGFGTDGKVITYWGCGSSITSIAMQPNGKIVAAGNIGCGSSPIALARYNPDGSLDESFGYFGLVMTELDDYSYCFTVALQADGKVVAAGFAGNGEEYSNFALARYK
jgi:uncharacterized delta-60 repeat protein